MKRSRWRQRGNALIEAGLAIPAFFLLFAGVSDFGRSFWFFNEAVSASRDAAQVVVNNYPSYATTTTNDSSITSALAADNNMSGLSGTVSRFYTCPNSSGDDGGTQYAYTPGTTTPTCSPYRIYVKIQASAPFTAVTPHPMILYPSHVYGTAIVRVQ